MSDRNKFTGELDRNMKKQKTADDDPHAYAGADENSSDSNDEVKLMSLQLTKNILHGIVFHTEVIFLFLH